LVDVVVGAIGADNNGRRDSGSAFVVYGRKRPGDVDLALLENDGYRIDGAMAGDVTGWAVAGAGDVNGDGVSDMIVGAPKADLKGFESGAAYVLFGETHNQNVDLLNLGERGFAIIGGESGDEAGYAVANAGDVNKDGFDDLLVGAPLADNNGRPSSGSAYVIFGKRDNMPVDLGLVGVSGTAGYRIDGAHTEDRLGSALSNANDVNADGSSDALIGAPLASNNSRNRSGSAYLVFGEEISAPGNHRIDTAELMGHGYRIDGSDACDSIGYSVAGSGDVNGDGLPDLVLGAPTLTSVVEQPGRSSEDERSTFSARGKSEDGSCFRGGSAYVVFGDERLRNVDLDAIEGRGFRIKGRFLDRAGHSVALLPDVNGDGRSEVIVGAPQSNTRSGQASGAAYLIYGRRKSTTVRVDRLGSSGYKLIGAGTDDHLGWSVSSGGDIDGNGIADVLMGAHLNNALRRRDSGSVYALFFRERDFE
jgi:hypothetical protein